jgi:hypothetical protein
MTRFTLPEGRRGAGQIQVTVTADYYNQLFESKAAGDAENNNSASRTFTSALAPYPDFSVANLAVTSDTGLQSGADVTVSWDDVNSLTGAANTAPFSDYVTVLNTTTGQTLYTVVIPYDAASSTLAPGQHRSWQHTLTLPEGTAAVGQLQFSVTTNYGNRVFEDNADGTATSNNSASVTLPSTPAPHADLAVSDVSVTAGTTLENPARVVAVGDPAQITVSWTVSNIGTGPGKTTSWVDRIIARPDTAPGGPGDVVVVLGQFTHNGLLAPQNGGPQNGPVSSTRTETILLPPSFHGRYHLFVQTDATGQVFENGSTANNLDAATRLLDVTPKAYADLVVSAAATPATGNSGRPLHGISWTVTNQGIGPTDTGHWSDTVYLASDPAGSNIVASLGTFDHIGTLAAGASYDQSVDVVLPNGLEGTDYVVVATGGPYEFLYASNNRRVAGPVQVTLSPFADLEVSAVSGPTQAVAGSTVEVSWTVTNHGQATADGVYFTGGGEDGDGVAHFGWLDHVTLREVNGTRVFDLGSFAYGQTLDPGKFYNRTQVVRLPSDVQGQFRIAVTTNAGNSVYEHGNTTDNTLLATDPLVLSLQARPDLQVPMVTTSTQQVQAGGTIDVEFDVINRSSTVATTTPHWTDKVYLSTGPTPIGGIELASVGNGSALGPGDSYHSPLKGLVIPRSFSGAGYVVVVVNADRAVNEFPKTTSDFRAVPLTVTALTPSDLVISDVSAPDQACDGSLIKVHFRVTNRGAGDTFPESWTDTVWLDRDKKRPTNSVTSVAPGCRSAAPATPGCSTLGNLTSRPSTSRCPGAPPATCTSPPGPTRTSRSTRRPTTSTPTRTTPTS